MNEVLSALPLKSWQFYCACRRILGEKFLTKLYNRSQRQVYRWCADPNFTVDKESNPLDLLSVLLKHLCEIGREDIARSALTILAESCGFEVVDRDVVVPDKCNLEEECLDDYPVVVQFHNAMRVGSDLSMIAQLLGEAKEELDQTFVCYRLMGSEDGKTDKER